MDEGSPSTRLRELARRVPIAWWLPVPAVVIDALVLLFSRRVWTTVIETSSRSGRAGHSVAAHAYLTFLAIGLVGYAAVGAFVGASGGRGMREPTESEVAVARVMLRGLCLVGLYLQAFVLVRDYVIR